MTRTDPAQAGARALGRETAAQHVTAQADAGMPTGRIAQIQHDPVRHLLSGAGTLEGRAFASEYDWTARTLVHELHELQQPEPKREAG